MVGKNYSARLTVSHELKKSINGACKQELINNHPELKHSRITEHMIISFMRDYWLND